jgi:SAM-dependent methyltransferase
MPKRSELFGQVAKQYKKYRSSYDLRTYRLLASLLGGKNKKYKILDIGCGTGKSTEPLVKVFKQAEIIGCDPDKRMLAEARCSAKKLKQPIEYIIGLAEKMPFKNNYFDAVISGTAFHWFSSIRAVREIKRALKNGGLFFVFWNIFTKDDGLLDWAALGRKYQWKRTSLKFKENPDSLKNIFKKSGFKKVKIVRIPFTDKKTAMEIIGGLKTNSSYLLLTPEKKREFIEEMQAIFRKFSDKKIIFKREIFICYGFKK